MIRLSTLRGSLNDVLKTILSSGIARSLTGKAFIINLIPEIGSYLQYGKLITSLGYVIPCILLTMLAYVVETVFFPGAVVNE